MSRFIKLAPKLILAIVTALFTVLWLFRLGADNAQASWPDAPSMIYAMRIDSIRM